MHFRVLRSKARFHEDKCSQNPFLYYINVLKFTGNKFRDRFTFAFFELFYIPHVHISLCGNSQIYLGSFYEQLSHLQE